MLNLRVESRLASLCILVAGTIVLFGVRSPSSSKAQTGDPPQPEVEEPSNEGAPEGQAEGAADEPGVGDPSSQASSNAGNFQTGVNVSVNPRTGGVSIVAELFRLPGIRHEMSATYSLHYDSADANTDQVNNKTVFGLPFGWSSNLSYVDKGELNVDGSQSYTLDDSWGTLVTVGTSSFTILTGLKQYNRADANLVVTETGYTLNNLNGMTRNLTSTGLLAQEVDRFGNTITFSYNEQATPEGALIEKMVDTWNNTTTWSYENPASELTIVTMTLPDQRTVQYAVENGTIVEVVDAQGKYTLMQWGRVTDPSCGVNSDLDVLQKLISPTGGITEIAYTCIPVCSTQSDPPSNCSATQTSQPAVESVTTCPAFEAGTFNCSGTPLTTKYEYSYLENTNNYTGYPLFSPFPNENTVDPTADPVMLNGMSDNFEYNTVVQQLDTSGNVAHETVNTYNYLHLLTESDTYLGDGTLIKQVAHCYAALNPSCPATLDYEYDRLPANYQSARATGSCVFNADGTGEARRSLVLRDYNEFGHVTHEQKYHGLGGSANVQAASCTPDDMLSTSNLTLVHENYHSYDTPAFEEGALLPLGQGSGHYGLLTASAMFSYADVLDVQEGQYCAAGGTSPPAGGSGLRSTLSCMTLTDESTDNVPTNSMIKQHLAGSLELSVDPSSALAQCANTATASWELTSTAPPKTTSLSYQSDGRITGRTLAWSGIGTTPPGISSSTERLAYAIVSDTSCPTSATTPTAALQTTHTDALGYTTTTKSCTQNGFLLSATDADGDTTTYEHDAVGMTKLVTHPNGTQVKMDHYYACPSDQSSMQVTCPSSVTSCPLASDRSCIVRTLQAGQGNTSYADGVSHTVVKDGLGRTISTWDNLGGANFSTTQQRSMRVYNDLGLLTSHVARVGTNTTNDPPLIYTTSTSYGPKFRPQTVCGPRLTAHQFVHDDVLQTTKTFMNGNQREEVEYNDSRRPTVIVDCAVGGDTSGGAVGSCPSTAMDLSTATCSGTTNYTTTLLRDGSGVTHSTSAANLNAEALLGATTECLAGTTTYSADLHKYQYSFNSAATTEGETNDTGVTGAGTWSRDLHGMSLLHNLSVTAQNDISGTGGTGGSGEPSGGFNADCSAASQAQSGICASGTSGVQCSFQSDCYEYNALGQETTEVNKLSTIPGNDVTLQNKLTYTKLGQLSTHTDYAGTTFHNYYDNMKRLTRFCYATKNADECEGIDTTSCDGTGLCCTAGENYVRDPITGRSTQVTHFTNSDTTCSASGDGDVEGDSIHYEYTTFGAISSKVYMQNVVGAGEGSGNIVTAALQWGYDPYHRPVCFRDVMAYIENGGSSSVCGNATTAVPTDFSPEPSNEADRYLSWYVYYDDDDQYRRGLLQSACRIVSTDSTSSGFDVRCTDVDYYTAVSTDGGACDISTQVGAPGAFAGLVKSRTHCKGASCADGGTLMYSTTHQYDGHRRPCRVVSTDADAQVILGSTYVYDQYDNLLSETAFSDLDPSDDSNYAQSYVYDGMLRLLSRARTDSGGNLLQTIEYQYDAASNILTKVEKTYDGGTGGAGGAGGAGTGGAGGTVGQPGGGGGCGSCTVSGTGAWGDYVAQLILFLAVGLWWRRRTNLRPRS